MSDPTPDPTPVVDETQGTGFSAPDPTPASDSSTASTSTPLDTSSSVGSVEPGRYWLIRRDGRCFIDGQPIQYVTFRKL